MGKAPSTTDGPSGPFEPNRNISKLLLLAATVEAAPEAQFDMASAAVPLTCGTAGCIAGWAATLWSEAQDSITPAKFGSSFIYWDIDKIVKRLGISHETAWILFCPEDEFYDNEGECIIMYSEISRARAAQELRRLAFDGIVSWAEAPSPYWLLRQCDGLSANNAVVPMWLLSKSTSSAGEPNIYWLSSGEPVGPFSTEAEAIRDFNASV